MQPRAGTGGGGGHQPAAGGQGGGGGTGDDEAPKDPGARITHQSHQYTEKDFEGNDHLYKLFSDLLSFFFVLAL